MLMMLKLGGEEGCFCTSQNSTHKQQTTGHEKGSKIHTDGRRKCIFKLFQKPLRIIFLNFLKFRQNLCNVFFNFKFFLHE